jgi:hypothetical protein
MDKPSNPQINASEQHNEYKFQSPEHPNKLKSPYEVESLRQSRLGIYKEIEDITHRDFMAATKDTLSKYMESVAHDIHTLKFIQLRLTLIDRLLAQQKWVMAKLNETYDDYDKIVREEWDKVQSLVAVCDNLINKKEETTATEEPYQDFDPTIALRRAEEEIRRSEDKYKSIEEEKEEEKIRENNKGKKDPFHPFN